MYYLYLLMYYFQVLFVLLPVDFSLMPVKFAAAANSEYSCVFFHFFLCELALSQLPAGSCWSTLRRRAFFRLSLVYGISAAFFHKGKAQLVFCKPSACF